MSITLVTALILAVCHLIRSAPNCIELLSGNSYGLFCPSYSDFLPPDIPTGKLYTKLQIESANFPYGGAVLSKENFTRLQSLTYLRITSSGVERINPEAFYHLKQLAHLDLSKNRLTFIEPGTFRGLKLRKLILSGNIGLKLPSTAFSGAKIFNFVAKDCDIHSIPYALFKQSGTRHISLVNNRIRTLSEEFSAVILPSDGHWGSIDLSNNSLVCDCALLWLAQLLYKQRRSMDEISPEMVSARSLRYPRETPEEEIYKPMYLLNLTCSAPKNLAHQRFPLPSEFDCPSPEVTGIEITVIGKYMEAVQLTCHARGRPTPNVAWAFQQHNQEVHRIIKSPTKLSSWSGDQLMNVSIGLNVSLRDFHARDFSCIAWTDSGINKAAQISASQDNWIGQTSASSSSIVQQGPPSPDQVHRVGVRLSGLQVGNQESLTNLIKASITNISASDERIEASVMDSVSFSPYQQLFIKRFTPLDLIGAILGTFVATLILLCLITRCIPRCYHHKFRQSKHALLQYERKQMTTPFLNGENKHESETLEQNKIRSLQHQSSAYFTEVATTVGSGSGLAYWPVQDYAYSTHEYDVPGMTDPLAGAMPLSPHPMMGIPNATGTLVRRGRPVSATSLHPSAIQTPYLFPKSANSTTGLILPPVATVPPLGIVTSPFLSYATVTQPLLPNQQPPIYFTHNQQMSLNTLPNGRYWMTPTVNRSMNGAASPKSEEPEPEACAESSVTSCNSDKSATERLIGASELRSPTQ